MARLPLALDRVGCKGKFLYFALAGDASLWSTLGMTGGWTLRPAPRSGPLSRELQLEVKLGTLSVREWLFREPGASPADASSSGGAADDPSRRPSEHSGQPPHVSG